MRGFFLLIPGDLSGDGSRRRPEQAHRLGSLTSDDSWRIARWCEGFLIAKSIPPDSIELCGLVKQRVPGMLDSRDL